MFQSIRNFFRDLFFGKDELPDVIWNQEHHFHVVHEDEVLTQAELQQLQRIVAEKIFKLERDAIFCKYAALLYDKGSEDRDFLFKGAFKKQSKINKLSALQYRLKHKIAVKG